MNPSSNDMPRGRAYAYIRFSNDDQKKGHSLDRQVANVRAFAEAKGLRDLDTDTFRDLGVSAYSGANVAKGSALTAFLNRVKAGEIGKGDWLIIENIDRLSRQSIENTFSLLMTITTAGVTVGTALDGQVYQKNKYDLTAIMRAAVAAQIANEESVKRSERLRDAWARKRAAIGEKKLTRKCPGWLSMSPDRKSFSVIKDRAAVVRRIFAETADGKGKRRIANALNAAKIPAWKNGQGWSSTTVAGVLGSRAVLGEFTPCKMEGGKRVPVGEPDKNYFPRIVSEQDFYAAQSVVKGRHNRGGRTSETVNNLFTGIAFCGQCGGPVHYCDKSRGAVYLRCDRTARKLAKCSPYSRMYGVTEREFIAWCVNFDFSGGQKTVRREKEIELAALEGRRSEMEKRLERLTEAVAASDQPVRSLLPKIQAAEREIAFLNGAEVQLKAEINATNERVSGANFEEMAKSPDNRFRLREEIKRRVEKITFYFVPPKYEPTADPYFTVALKDGSSYDIFSKDTVRYWTKDGKYYLTEPEPTE